MAQLMVGMVSANPEFPLKADAIKLTTDNEKIIFNIKLDRESLDKISEMAKENKAMLSPGL